MNVTEYATKLIQVLLSMMVISVVILIQTKNSVVELILLLVGIIIIIVFLYFPKLLRSRKKKKENISDEVSYHDKIKYLLDNLKKSSIELDKSFEEISLLSKEKKENLDLLENNLNQLTIKENELKSKIETLEKVPVEAIKHFEEVLNKGDKRSTFRDYFLFLLGVIVSIITSIVLKQVGFG